MNCILTLILFDDLVDETEQLIETIIINDLDK